MRKLVFVVLIGMGAWYSSQGQLPFFSPPGAYDESGNPVVWLFTIQNCGGHCGTARNQLKRRGVVFEEKLINPNDDNDENVKLWKKFGKTGFPLTVSGEEKLVGAGSKTMMATFFGLSSGDKYLTSTEKRYFKKHFYPDGSPKIIMYGADWCPYCRKLRDEFQASNVDFIEIDVEKSGEKDRMSRTMEIGGYPATWVGYKRVNGGNLKAVNKVLNSY